MLVPTFNFNLIQGFWGELIENRKSTVGVKPTVLFGNLSQIDPDKRQRQAYSVTMTSRPL